MYDKELETIWGLVFGGASLLAFVLAVLSACFWDWQHIEALLLFAIYTMMLARG